MTEYAPADVNMEDDFSRFDTMDPAEILQPNLRNSRDNPRTFSSEDSLDSSPRKHKSEVSHPNPAVSSPRNSENDEKEPFNPNYFHYGGITYYVPSSSPAPPKPQVPSFSFVDVTDEDPQAKSQRTVHSHDDLYAVSSPTPIRSSSPSVLVGRQMTLTSPVQRDHERNAGGRIDQQLDSEGELQKEWDSDDEFEFGNRAVVVETQETYRSESEASLSNGRPSPEKSTHFVSEPPSPAPSSFALDEDVIQEGPLVYCMHSVASGSSVGFVNEPGQGADENWSYPEAVNNFIAGTHHFLSVPGPQEDENQEVDLAQLLQASEQALIEDELEQLQISKSGSEEPTFHAFSTARSSETTHSSAQSLPVRNPTKLRIRDSEEEKSSKYIQNFNLAHQNGRGDILVDIPDQVTSLEFLDPSVPLADRLKGAYASKLPKALLMMLLGPVSPSPVTFPLSVDAKELISIVKSKALIEKTFASYGGCVLKFIKFCDTQNAPPEAVLPSNGELVLAFLASLKGLRVDTIRRYLCAIRFWNGYHGLRVDVPEKQWTIVAQGLKYYEPASKVSRRELTISDLQIIVKGLDMNDDGDVAIKSALLFGFHAILRVGEFVVPLVDYFQERENVSIDNVTFVPAADDLPGHCIVHIPYDKVNKFKGRDTLIFPGAASPELDPLAAFKNHLAVNKPPQKYGLFSYRSRADPNVYRGLTHSAFIKRINVILVAAGRPPISGHEIRIGGCTYYLLIGRSPDVVKMQGGWSSPAWFKYWRNIVTIAAKEINTMDLYSSTGQKVTREEEEEDFEEEEEGGGGHKPKKAAQAKRVHSRPSKPSANASQPSPQTAESATVASIPSRSSPVDNREYDDDFLSELSSEDEELAPPQKRIKLAHEGILSSAAPVMTNGRPSGDIISALPPLPVGEPARRRSLRIQKERV